MYCTSDLIPNLTDHLVHKFLFLFFIAYSQKAKVDNIYEYICFNLCLWFVSLQGLLGLTILNQFFFVSSAVILPTIWRYLQTLEAAPYFLGLALSAFSLSGLLAGPLFGLLSDRTQTTKKIILVSNLFEIVGECHSLHFFHL